MLNYAAKIYNISPKPDSKHQQWLRDNARSYNRVTCAECGEGHTTLYKVVGSTTAKNTKIEFWHDKVPINLALAQLARASDL